MSESLTVVIASTLKDQAYKIRSILDRDRDVRSSVKIIGGNGHTDPLHGIAERPDLLILILGPAWESELDSLGQQSSMEVPEMIVLASGNNAAQMRRAMKAGARDFLDLGVDADELLRVVHQIGGEARRPVLAKPSGTESTLAVLNSKGGSGASFVASSLAHALAKGHEQRVALIDLDLQFGVQDLCQDLKPRTSLLDAIGRADQLDAVALEGCMGQHANGVRLLGEYGNALPLPWEVPRAGLERLLKVAASSYEHVIVDLPRQIDPLTSTALEAATQVFVVMNQSLIHLRDTKRMLQILTRELGIPRAKLRIVVNRYLPDAPVTLRDIQDAAELDTLIQIPNDFRRASESMNLGEPLVNKNPGAAITKGFTDMATLIAGSPNKKKSSGLRGAIAGLFGQSGER